MKWNIFLLVFSILILILFAGGGFIEYLAQADAIAEQLAPQIGVSVNILRSPLQNILEEGSLYRVIVYCTPWAILSILLTVRLIADVVEERRCHPPIKK